MLPIRPLEEPDPAPIITSCAIEPGREDDWENPHNDWFWVILDQNERPIISDYAPTAEAAARRLADVLKSYDV